MLRDITSFGAKSESLLPGHSHENHFLLIVTGLTQTTFLPLSVLLKFEFANYGTIINYSGLESRNANGIASISGML